MTNRGLITCRGNSCVAGSIYIPFPNGTVSVSIPKSWFSLRKKKPVVHCENCANLPPSFHPSGKPPTLGATEFHEQEKNNIGKSINTAPLPPPAEVVTTIGGARPGSKGENMPERKSEGEHERGRECDGPGLSPPGHKDSTESLEQDLSSSGRSWKRVSKVSWIILTQRYPLYKWWPNFKAQVER